MSKAIFDVLLQQWLESSDLEEISDELEGIQLIPVQSSNLAAVGYNENRYILIVAFLDGSIYRYEGVPPEEFTGLLGADSHGEFFHDNIREIYAYERIVG